MRIRHLWYTISLTVLALLPCSLLTACGQPQHSADGLNQIEERELPSLCNETIGYIENAHAVALELEDFKWSEFNTIGLLLPPAGLCAIGTCVVEKQSVDRDSIERWVPVHQMLPSADAAKPLLVCYDKCLNMVNNVSAKCPYGERQTDVNETEEPMIAEWQELCSQLEAMLVATERLTLNHKNNKEMDFDQIKEYMDNSDANISQKYLEKFQSRCTEYTNLIDEMIMNMRQARKTLKLLTEMTNLSDNV